jgi:serine/threonine protein kinase
MFVGSLQYVAPEELRGETVDQRSDTYSLGCMLYEMLTGERAFPQTILKELLAARLANAYRPMVRRSWRTPRRLRQLVDRCLALDPARRPPSVDVVHGHLSAALARRSRQTIERVVRAYVERPPGRWWGSARRLWRRRGVGRGRRP